MTATAAAIPEITAVSSCHPHGTVQFCQVGTTEFQVIGPTATEEFAPQYTGCHAHDAETYCFAPDGSEVQVLVDGVDENHSGDEHAHEEEETGGCHFHAGVEHCPGAETVQCLRTDREYNIPLRVGLLFVILITSAIGVFTPILATRFTRLTTRSLLFTALKQFGTGVVISTAFIHLFTHAQLLFANECLGELGYEGTTAAIFMAGLFLAFLVEYVGARFVGWRKRTRASALSTPELGEENSDGKTAAPAGEEHAVGGDGHADAQLHAATAVDEKLGVVVLEAGVIFHSLLIGLTLVVAGDSFFLTLFAVILFHQMFEGVALGTCIAALPDAVALMTKMLMAAAFALITPLGMGIGIGVLRNFNGNDRSTLVAIGTLDALSAGILAWVGLVEMLARDWMGGALAKAGVVRTAVGMVSLVAGLVLMSVLGKWA
ncbi:Zip-domain-containing protein [Polyplosphaeria fusca]|uniref:Zip-domain-containing protein n=1 Tax=Polyplosphaeria fusca TaxID=682080 RepID=A0A9P4UYV2_9PLEO|nr:Zip-domain-containing protein [Polyplosphaeria fusca]